jgi:hypothetical protein
MEDQIHDADEAVNGGHLLDPARLTEVECHGPDSDSIGTQPQSNSLHRAKIHPSSVQTFTLSKSTTSVENQTLPHISITETQQLQGPARNPSVLFGTRYDPQNGVHGLGLHFPTESAEFTPRRQVINMVGYTDGASEAEQQSSALERRSVNPPHARPPSSDSEVNSKIADENLSTQRVLFNEDDLFMVSEEDCSQEAKEKFRSHRSGGGKNMSRSKAPIVIDDDHSNNNRLLVKRELKNNENSDDEQRSRLTPLEMLRRQKACIARNVGSTKPTHRNSPFLNQGSNSSSRRRLTTNQPYGDSPSQFQDILNDNDEIKLLMRRDNEEDHDWMHNSGSDGGQSDELERLERLKLNFEQRRRRAGKVSKLDSRENLKEGRGNGNGFSESDQFELQRIIGQIELIKKRAQLAERHQGRGKDGRIENEMFVSDPEDDRAIREALAEDAKEKRTREYMELEDERLARATQESFNQQDSGNWNKTRGGKKQKGGMKKMTKRAKTAREVEDARREKEREKSCKKAGRDKSNSKGGSSFHNNPVKSGRTGSKKGRKEKEKPKKKVHKSRMRNGWHNTEDLAFKAVLDDLIHNDFIADRAAQKDYGLAPSINERTKERQLQALLASVPVDDGVDLSRSKNQMNAIRKASKRFGYGLVKAAPDGTWKLKGMKTTIYHHQLLAADWMVGRELGLRAPHGGLLADAMGLGKTLEMLATMIGNPPSNDHLKRGVKATLLVLPSSAIRQWMEEIKDHCEGSTFPRVMHYKSNKEIPLITLKDQDIVLTSFAEVMGSQSSFLL